MLSQRGTTHSITYAEAMWHYIPRMLSQRGMTYNLRCSTVAAHFPDSESTRNDIQLTLSQRRIMFPPDTMRMHLSV